MNRLASATATDSVADVPKLTDLPLSGPDFSCRAPIRVLEMRCEGVLAWWDGVSTIDRIFRVGGRAAMLQLSLTTYLIYVDL